MTADLTAKICIFRSFRPYEPAAGACHISLLASDWLHSDRKVSSNAIALRYADLVIMLPLPSLPRPVDTDKCLAFS